MVDSRGIVITQDAYDALKSIQQKGESYSQIILRLVHMYQETKTVDSVSRLEEEVKSSD